MKSFQPGCVKLAFLNAGIKLTLSDERVTLEDGSFKNDIYYSEAGFKRIC